MRKEIILQQVSRKRSEINEKSLKNELTRYFENLKKEILKRLEENWKDYTMFQSDMDLICAPILESHDKYYEIIKKHVTKEYKFGMDRGKKLVKLARKKQSLNRPKISLKSYNLPLSAFIQKDELFKPMEWTEDELYNQVFHASEKTLMRVNNEINNYLSTGYKTGQGINFIGKQITRRFDQLKDWESRRIARTEIHKAHNTGTMRAYGDLGVEYTQWDCSIDGRQRDSHEALDGEIIAMGNTYSNGLHYPGDSSTGNLKEFINCRCGNLPFIMPYDKIAPPGQMQFREHELISIKVTDYNTLIDNVINGKEFSSDYVNEIMNRAKRTVNEWNINRLTPGEREVYLKYKKNVTILKDALINHNYNDLDKLEDLGGFYAFRDKKSFYEWTDNLRNFDELKDELEDIIEDIREYEQIIKDTNIEVLDNPVKIQWFNDFEEAGWKNFTTDYNYVDFDYAEEFYLYHFVKEDVIIYESVDAQFSRVRTFHKMYKDLPENMKLAKSIILSNQKPTNNVFESLGGYVLEEPGNNAIFQFRNTLSESKRVFIHETAHLLEKDFGYFISNSRAYASAFYKDKQRLTDLGYELEDTYVTQYAHNFTERALTGGYGDYRIFSEDFAESLSYYITNKEAFTKKFPEKAKFLEKVLKNRITPQNSVHFKAWKDVKYSMFELSEEESDRYLELHIKEHLYAKEGKLLSKAEREELKWYDDMKTMDYLHKKRLDLEPLTKEEMKAYEELTKRLHVPKQALFDVEMHPRVKMRQEIRASKKDLFKLSPAEKEEMKEIQDKLRNHSDELGFIEKRKLEKKYELLYSKYYYNQLRNYVIDAQFDNVDWEELERLHKQFKYYKTVRELEQYNKYTIKKVKVDYKDIHGFRLTDEEMEIYNILKNNPLNIEPYPREKKLLRKLRDKKRLGELHQKLLDPNYFETHGDLPGLDSTEAREYFALYNKYKHEWGLPDIDIDYIKWQLEVPNDNVVDYYMPHDLHITHVVDMHYTEMEDLQRLLVKQAIDKHSLTPAEQEKLEFLIAKRDFNKIYSLRLEQKGLFYKEEKLYWKYYLKLRDSGEFDNYDVSELIDKFEKRLYETYFPNVKWEEVSHSKYKKRKGSYDDGMPYRVTDLTKMFTIDTRFCTEFEKDLANDWLGADYRRYREFIVNCEGDVNKYAEWLMQNRGYTEYHAREYAMETAYNTVRLANLLNNQTKEPMTFFRCETKLHLGDNPKVGDIVTLEGFNSFAISEEGMKFFESKSRKTITAYLEIEAPTGTRGAYVAPISPTPYKPEMEFLAQLNSKMEIIELGEKEGKAYAKLRVVNDYDFEEVLNASDIGLKLR